MSNPSFVQSQNIVVAHKKKLCGIIVLVAALGIFAVGVHTMFQVRGVVTSVVGSPNRISKGFPMLEPS